MKKIIFRFILLSIVTFFLLISYLSIIGVETKKFNNQIENKIKNLNKDLEIELNQVKIILDAFKFEINAKTIGSKIKYKEKKIDLEFIKTKILINSLINKKFLLSNLEISTKSLELKNLISLIRNLENRPELYILEKFIKKGFVIADVKVEFNEKGEIKKNYSIVGFVRDIKINFLEKYKIDKFNFTFEIKEQISNFENIQVSLNNIPFLSKKIALKKANDHLYIEGEVENKDIDMDKKNINLFINPLVSVLDIKKINFNSKNKFSFKILKKLILKILNYPQK